MTIKTSIICNNTDVSIVLETLSNIRHAFITLYNFLKQENIR